MTKEEINKLITDNINLAYQVYWEFAKQYNNGIDKEDLLSLAFIGLTKAANTFDPSKNFTFSTYSYKVMQNEILMELRTTMKQKKYNISFVSTSETIDDTDLTIGDVLKNIEYDDDTLFTEKDYENLYEYINELDELSQKILYYKLEGLTQTQIGKKLGFSQGQISRLLSKAINKLRYKFRKEEL